MTQTDEQREGVAMDEVKRWTLKNSNPTLIGAKYGEWVHYSNYAALQKKANALRDALEKYRKNSYWLPSVPGTELAREADAVLALYDKDGIR